MMSLLWPLTAPITALTRMPWLLNFWTKEPHRSSILERPDGVHLIQERGAQSCLSPERHPPHSMRVLKLRRHWKP